MPRTIAVCLGALTLSGCAKPEGSAKPPAPRAARPAPGATAAESSPAATPAPAPVPPATAGAEGTRTSASREAEEACVDRWLAERGLDAYGNPQGTMYAGGTPLFDERTGEQVDRLAYVYKRQPLARAACRPSAIR
ncbi:MAG TPA: hypothetical protein VIG50_17685 [Vicinamibacteria bacterium]